MRISHEAIYQALYIQGRGALRRELTACLRTGRALRVPRARPRGRGKSSIVPETMISERPAEAADRAGPAKPHAVCAERAHVKGAAQPFGAGAAYFARPAHGQAGAVLSGREAGESGESLWV